LEVWFEFTIISNFQYLVSLHWTMSFAAGAMLVAHWLYLLAALIELCLMMTSELFQKEDANIVEAKRSAAESLSLLAAPARFSCEPALSDSKDDTSSVESYTA